ncbi:MAG TPA: PfkB family carbohydrate kinase [Methanobacterium sp.]|nr:PfkB family carbohydrate kinase [Methanobacterium sp.]
MFNVTLIGPIAEDTIIKSNSSYKSPGGAVFYQSNILSNLKINTNAIVTISGDNRNLLKAFPSDINIIPFYVKRNTKFQNIYYDNNPNHRIQKASIPKNPIELKNILNQINNSSAFLLGPLCPYDIPLKTIEDLSKLKKPIYLGAQGYLRHLQGDKILLKPWHGFEKFLKFIDILFIDENESSIILGEKHSLEETAKKLSSFGPEEVIITCGNRGSIIYSSKLAKIYKIPAFKPQKIEDPTGLGDTYMAAYAARKVETEDPKKCGIFAAAAASVKLENKGPFKGDRNQIIEKCNNLK